jgi:hypothetical protein
VGQGHESKVNSTREREGREASSTITRERQIKQQQGVWLQTGGMPWQWQARERLWLEYKQCKEEGLALLCLLTMEEVKMLPTMQYCRLS